MTELSKPLVSIGVPTYNRVHDLEQAIRSVLEQDYENIEIIISDNASSDTTQQLCEQYARSDPRITYIRQPRNLGPRANFSTVLEKSKGKFFMWLGDDDWIDANFISLGVETLMSRSQVVMASGQAQYYRNGTYSYTGKSINLEQDDGSVRLREYYRMVKDNGTLYGLMRRKNISRVKLQNAIGGDWFVVAAMAYMGQIATNENTSVHREVGLSSGGYRAIAKSMGLSYFQTLVPHWTIIANIFRDIAFTQDVYADIGRPSRYWLGAQAAAIVFKRKALSLLRMTGRALRFPGWAS